VVGEREGLDFKSQSLSEGNPHTSKEASTPRDRLESRCQRTLSGWGSSCDWVEELLSYVEQVYLPM